MKSKYYRKPRMKVDLTQLIIAFTILLIIGGSIYSHVFRVENATEALKEEGYTGIKVGEWYPWCWSRTIGSRFEAIDSTGKKVQGTVCLNLFFSDVDIK